MTDVNALQAALLAGKVTVWFTKVNGHKRTMVCTLSPAALPQSADNGKSNTTRDPNLKIVFDTQNEGWRTIKLDSIIKWEPGEVADVPAEMAPPTIGWTPNPGVVPTPVTPTPNT